MLVSRQHLVTDTRAARDPLPEVAAALHAGVGRVHVRATMGGVDRVRLPGPLAAGVHGAAVVSALWWAADLAAAAAALPQTVRSAASVTSAGAPGGD